MAKDIVISLFDKSGVFVEPWAEAGYNCYIVDIQHPPAYSTHGITVDDRGITKVWADLSRPWLPPIEIHRERIAFVAAWPPCDHLAVSGVRWFKGKGLRLLSDSISMFATAAEFCEWSGAPYLIENPNSNIASHWRKSDYRFHPHEFTAFEEDDNYTKMTCLWTGNGFVMPEECKASDLGDPDDRIHKCAPGPNRAEIRGKTPLGFSKAVFLANSIELNRVA